MSRAGRILRLDLSSGSINTVPTSEYVKEFIGGGAVGAKLIWDNVPPEVKGLDPENMLTFNAGPLTGTLLGNKCEVIAKSPKVQNHPMVTAGMGGQFASEIKFACYDHIAITGKAHKPVYLSIENDRVEIKDASHLWGLDTQVVQERIRDEIKDQDVQIACIGQAGENQVACALIVHDIQNAAGQGGLGAVMGSKNLKAVAVRGTRGLRVADRDGFMALWEDVYDEFLNGRSVPITKTFHKNQLASHADLYSDHNLARWGYGVDAKPVYPQKDKEDYLLDFDQKHTVGNLGCTFCPIQCQKNYSVPGGDNGGCACFVNVTCRWTARNFDTHVWWKAIARLQRYGMDSLEITGIVGWLMLLYEKGYISAEDTDGVPMEWGSEEAILTVIDRIAFQESFGTYFKGGIIHASKSMAAGKGYELAVHDRNIAVPFDIYPDRGVMTLGVGGNQLMRAATQLLWYEPHVDRYALYQLIAKEMGIPEEEALALQERWLAEFAEKHTGKKDAWKPDAVEGKAGYVASVENVIAASDIAGRCDGPSARIPHSGYTWDVEHIARAISVATGDECSTERLLDVIQKKRLLETSYNILCETMIGDFPEITESNVKMFNDPVKDGFFKGSTWNEEGCENAGAEYCMIRGCDPSTGIPTRKELERLGLGYVAEKLAEFGFDLDPEVSDEVHSNEWR